MQKPIKANKFFMLSGVDAHIMARVSGLDFILTHAEDLYSQCELTITVARKDVENHPHGWTVSYNMKKDGVEINQAESVLIYADRVQGVIAAVANDAFMFTP